MDKKSAETIVKVFSIIGIVFSALAALGGLVMLFGGSFFIGMLGELGGFLSGAVIIAGVVTLILGLLFIWIYMKLMKHANWARILLSVLAILGFIGALFSLPASIINFIYYGLFVYFFMFEKTVVGLFTK